MTRAQAILLKSADRQGLVAAITPEKRHVAKKLVADGLLKHRHGMIYTLTPAGVEQVEQLRAEA